MRLHEHSEGCIVMSNNKFTDVSIIVPGYNTPESWWNRSLMSIRKAAPGAEIICIDDGSSDGAKFLDQIKDIKVVHQSNQGPNIARNIGLDLATRNWIGFVDSDDEVLPGIYEKCISEAEDSDIVIFGVEVIWPEDGLSKLDVVPTRKYGELTPKDLKDLSKACLFNYGCNKVYRRSFIERNFIRFPVDAVMGEDMIFNFNCVESGARWKALDEVGYRYYRTRATLLSRYKPKLVTGLKHSTALWRSYKNSHDGAWEVLGSFGEFDESQIRNSEWKNSWAKGSPFSLVERWKMRPGLQFFKMAMYSFFRRHFYVRPVRRWHIRRLYPHAVRWNG